MGRLQFFLPVVAPLTFACATALAQDSSTDSNREPLLSDTVKEFDRITANSEEVHESARPRAKEDKSSGDFLVSIPRFREATESLRMALGTDNDPKHHIRTLDKLIKPFTDYLKPMKLRPAPVDPASFKEYSRKDLEWETLTTAERIDNNLQRARSFVRDTAQTGAVTIQTMEFFADMHNDLTRLKWLTNKLTGTRPLTR
jgi:hypothetical protein